MLTLNDFLNIVFLLFLLQAFVPLFDKRLQMTKRFSAIRDFEKMRKSRVISMIHRQETLSILGIPVARYIDIEDSERVLRAIRLTPGKMPIDFIIHTPGGLVLAAEQIAYALKRHQGKVTFFVPHYAMSGGTLLALSADEVVMDPDAVLGPVDPQLGSPQEGTYPAASILAALKTPNPNRDDKTLILGNVSQKAIAQVHEAVSYLLKDKLPPKQVKKLADELSEGRWTHDYAITFDEAKEMGLPVRDSMPKKVYEIMNLYPQPGQRASNVEYIPLPYKINKKQ